MTRGRSEVISCDSRVDSAATATDASTDMLRIEGWGVNHKRVERIWRQEGLKVPQRQPKRGRLWLNDGSWHPAEAAVSGPRLGRTISWPRGRTTGVH